MDPVPEVPPAVAVVEPAPEPEADPMPAAEPAPPADPVTPVAEPEPATAEETPAGPTNCTFVDENGHKAVATHPDVLGMYVLRCDGGLYAANSILDRQRRVWVHKDLTRLNDAFEPVSDPSLHK